MPQSGNNLGDQAMSQRKTRLSTFVSIVNQSPGIEFDRWQGICCRTTGLTTRTFNDYAKVLIGNQEIYLEEDGSGRFVWGADDWVKHRESKKNEKLTK